MCAQQLLFIDTVKAEISSILSRALNIIHISAIAKLLEAVTLGNVHSANDGSAARHGT